MKVTIEISKHEMYAILDADGFVSDAATACDNEKTLKNMNRIGFHINRVFKRYKKARDKKLKARGK